MVRPLGRARGFIRALQRLMRRSISPL